MTDPPRPPLHVRAASLLAVAALLALPAHCVQPKEAGLDAGECALLERFWRISLSVTDNTITKLYVT